MESCLRVIDMRELDKTKSATPGTGSSASPEKAPEVSVRGTIDERRRMDGPVTGEPMAASAVRV
jgi:hypothetical protein